MCCNKAVLKSFSFLTDQASTDHHGDPYNDSPPDYYDIYPCTTALPPPVDIPPPTDTAAVRIPLTTTNTSTLPPVYNSNFTAAATTTSHPPVSAPYRSSLLNIGQGNHTYNVNQVSNLAVAIAVK